MPDTIHQLLQRYWGHSTFRPLQEDIIQSVLQGNDALALMPTGGGKSLCYQIPALAKDGLALVISPLIALMRDQVSVLKEKGIKAGAVYSGMTYREIDTILDNCIYGDYKLLYLSPERLSSELLIERVKQMKINLIAVDEAHCISQWGYDFRPAYLKIAEIRDILPNTPVLALTATATIEVQKDIQVQLKFKEGKVFKKSFERKNLSYSVLLEENKNDRLLTMFSKIRGSAIVYVRRRVQTKTVADFLQKNNIKADFYHAGLTAKQRQFKEEEWKRNHMRVMVCTNAFGMGIDKPDVRLVIHYNSPDSLEEYFQEAGRAGRDEKKAYSTWLYDKADLNALKATMDNRFPEVEDIRRTYDALGNYLQVALRNGEGQSYDFELTDFCKQYNFDPVKTFTIFSILEQDGWLALSDAIYIPSQVKVTAQRQELYRYEVEHPENEPTLKMLLRTAPGVLDSFTNVRERDLGAALKLTENDVAKSLESMMNGNILFYEKQNEKPQLTYLRSRAHANDLVINTKLLNLRKINFEKRIQSVLNYLKNSSMCRSRLLLQYFGEMNDHRCGICDVCLKRNDLGVTDMEMENIADHVKEELLQQPMSIREIVTKSKMYNEKPFIAVIQWLLDNNRLKRDKNDKLIWNE
jgi:ATP-dependent DNA helicase RecQ